MEKIYEFRIIRPEVVAVAAEIIAERDEFYYNKAGNPAIGLTMSGRVLRLYEEEDGVWVFSIEGPESSRFLAEIKNRLSNVSPVEGRDNYRFAEYLTRAR